VGRPPDVQRGRQPPRHRRRDPRGAAGVDAPRRRRWIAGRDGLDCRRACRRRPADPCSAPQGEAGPWARVSRRVRCGARRWRARRHPDGRRLVARSGDASGPGRADRAGRRGPRHRLALHGRWRGRRLGDRAARHLAWRLAVCTDRAEPDAERPDRRVQGVASVDAAGDPVRRRPCRRLRLPDRDDVPRVAVRCPHPRGADHVEALVVVVQLRFDEIRGRIARRRGS
jgi:hypothetical protein